MLRRSDDRRSGQRGLDRTWAEHVVTELRTSECSGEALDVEVVLVDAWPGDPLSSHDQDERFVLRWAEPSRVRVEAASLRGARWGLTELAGRSAPSAPGTVENDAPAFPVRGIIEGFYGSPWSQDQREDVIAFAARHRFNTFLYAPKDDPYLRRHWRWPHEGEAREQLEATIRNCSEHDVTALVGVSPGLSMRYSSTDDRELLGAKLEGLIEAGAGSIALLLDDIPMRLQHAEDIEHYPDLVTAHAELANWAFELLRGSEIPLVVCPTQYWGDGDERYIGALGRGIDPRIDLFWTGRAICSPAITAGEAAAFARSTCRLPLYWDNYPVNDVAMRHEMHIGPYERRDPLLPRFSRGVMANAMEHAEASKIPLATIGDYLWDPVGYEADDSWRRALSEAAGGSADDLRLFADTVRGSCLAEPDPVELGSALERFNFALEFGDAAQARRDLTTVASRLGAAVDRLLGDRSPNPALTVELRPWLAKCQHIVTALKAIARYAQPDGAVTREGGRALQATYDELVADPHRVCGDLVTMTIESMLDGAATQTRRTT